MSQHTFTLDGLELTLPIDWVEEPDDDGCGDPSISGNSMTGCRASRRVAVLGTLTASEMRDILIKVTDYIEEELAELEED